MRWWWVWQYETDETETCPMSTDLADSGIPGTGNRNRPAGFPRSGLQTRPVSVRSEIDKYTHPRSLIINANKICIEYFAQFSHLFYHFYICFAQFWYSNSHWNYVLFKTQKKFFVSKIAKIWLRKFHTNYKKFVMFCDYSNVKNILTKNRNYYPFFHFSHTTNFGSKNGFYFVAEAAKIWWKQAIILSWKGSFQL